MEFTEVTEVKIKKPVLEAIRANLEYKGFCSVEDIHNYNQMLYPLILGVLNKNKDCYRQHRGTIVQLQIEEYQRKLAFEMGTTFKRHRIDLGPGFKPEPVDIIECFDQDYLLEKYPMIEVKPVLQKRLFGEVPFSELRKYILQTPANEHLLRNKALMIPDDELPITDNCWLDWTP